MLSLILTKSTSSCPVIVSVPVTFTFPTVVIAAVVNPEVISTVPELLPDNCKLEFDTVVLITLSVILILSSRDQLLI